MDPDEQDSDNHLRRCSVFFDLVARGGVWPANPVAFVFKCLKLRIRNLVNPLPVCCLCCCSNEIPGGRLIKVGMEMSFLD